MLKNSENADFCFLHLHVAQVQVSAYISVHTCPGGRCQGLRPNKFGVNYVLIKTAFTAGNGLNHENKRAAFPLAGA
jgi:hypothetical protein